MRVVPGDLAPGDSGAARILLVSLAGAAALVSILVAIVAVRAPEEGRTEGTGSGGAAERQAGAVETARNTADAEEEKLPEPVAEAGTPLAASPAVFRHGVVLANETVPLPSVRVLIESGSVGSIERITDTEGRFDLEPVSLRRPQVRVSYPILDGGGRVAAREGRPELREAEGELRVHLPVDDGVILKAEDERGVRAPARLWFRIGPEEEGSSSAWRPLPFEGRGPAFFGGLRAGRLLDVIAWNGLHGVGEPLESPEATPAVGRARTVKARSSEIPTLAIRLTGPKRRVRVRLEAEGDGMVIGAVACDPDARDLSPHRDPVLGLLRFKPDPKRTGSYWVDAYRDLSGDLCVLTALGGAFLTRDDVASLEDGDVIPLAREGFVLGHWDDALACPQQAPGLVRVVLDDGSAIECPFISRGSYCVFVGDSDPRRLELSCGGLEAAVEAPLVGEIEVLRRER